MWAGLTAAAARCGALDVGFLSTPFDIESARRLVDELGMERIKVGSGELTNLPFLLDLSRLRRPLLLSTGMATLDEVRRALGAVVFARLAGPGEHASIEAFDAALATPEAASVLAETTVMQCVTEYPAPHDQANLRVLDVYAALGVRVGYSDHTEGVDVAAAAVARGAGVVEKHLTLSRDLPGPDHAASLEPDGFARMVVGIRRVEAALGSPQKRPVGAEIANRAVARRSLVAARDIAAGEAFGPDNLTAKRPGTGLAPERYWEMLGRPASRAYAADEMIEP